MERQLIDRIQNAIEYIESHVYEEIKIEDAARAAFMSQSSFYIVFSGVLGTTVKDYIRKRRLSLSAFDLIYSDFSVLDIALKYQYRTYESFSRAFKRLFGISPQGYREKKLYTNVFPRVLLSYHDVSGGNLMVNKEMNKNIIIDKINNLSNGYILDIDIDRFEQINEQYGRHTGDKVLVEVPERIKAILNRHQPGIDVIRINADEFAVIIKDRPESFVTKVCEDIINSMVPEFHSDGAAFNITVSIGISSFSVGNNNEEAIRNAKEAMLLAKKNGKNQYKLL